ncbi:hypothetical protein [Enterococcus sp. AZ196]|uniref:hypothetical protein n=1 Tax=Enterococcus sp. AZ196 TaxID=2774659 RepID=UPI003D26EAE7
MNQLIVKYIKETCVSLEQGKEYKAIGYDPLLKSIAVIDESKEAYLYPPSAFKIQGDYTQLPLQDNRV